MNIPESPLNIGFDHFDSWRPYQLETVRSIIESRKKVFMLDAPTGSGKSLIGMSVAKNFDRVLYLCTTKILQDQLTNDFPDIPIVKGRSNYPCLISKHVEESFPEITAEDCPKKFMEKQGGGESIKCYNRCPYVLAKKIALDAPIAILNTSYFLTEANFVGRFSEVDLLVIDEADELEDQLMKFIEIVITQRMLDKLNLPAPRYKTKFESWREWAIECHPIVKNMTTDIERSIGDPMRDRFKVRFLSSLKSLLWKMTMFVNVVDKNWVYMDSGDRWQFKPIWVSTFTKKYVFDHTEKALLMSATILAPLRVAQNLGIDRQDWEYKQIPSQFDPSRRRIEYIPVANMTKKTREEEIHNLVPAIKEILKENKNKKGLIHTVSYENARYIIEHVKSERLLSHNSKDRDQVIEKFKSDDEPLVLVSPSMDRGVDFKYDLCRFVVICKLPFPDLGDKQVSARVYGSTYGAQWYAWMTACNVVQMSGRGMRAEDDECKTVILDKQFERFYGQNNELFPNWWKEALVILVIEES